MLLDDEIRIAHREEVQNDNIVRELAKTQAMCWCKLEGGLCDDCDCCDDCDVFRKFNACYDQLPEYDQVRVDTSAELYYQQLTSPAFSTHKENVRYIIGIFLFTFIACAVVIAMANIYVSGDIWGLDGCPFASPSGRVEYVKKLMQEYPDKKYVYADGNEDCKDYAYFFKIAWDYLYDDDDCQIVYVYKYDYNNQRFEYHLMIFVDNQLIEPAYYCYDDYTRYYKIYRIDINSWCSLNNYKINSQKVKRWLYDKRVS